jgi:hypothetical protein
MKFDPWPTEKKTPLAIKESTLEAPKEDPGRKWCPSQMKRRLLLREAVRST